MKIHGIVGTFFQTNRRPAVVHSAESEGGTHAELRPEAGSHAFSGHFDFDETLSYGEGNMMDGLGPSKLIINYMSGDVLVFEKRYFHLEVDSIHYDVVRDDDGVWRGSYKSPLVGTGEVRCYVIELEPERFKIDPTQSEDNPA